MCTAKSGRRWETGYDQWLSLTLEKKCGDEKTAKAFFSRVWERLSKALESEKESYDQYDERFDGGEAAVECSLSGRHIYSDDGYIGDECDKHSGIKAADLSKELGCSISVSYEGEDREDTESLLFENGRRTSASVSVTVDLESDYIKQLDEILDDIRKKGLKDEADRIRGLFTEIAARYIFR